MTSPPLYFENIRKNAVRLWNQLEKDPELAGPWRQLFMQVQSPRHVVSELLQNADDAKATEAIIRIENGCFIFAHNGEDFTKDHFLSLCRFGYSNKRALHTIGFRGVGFKSVFSLGDTVELTTPTLSVAFRKARFTEPVWVAKPSRKNTRTEIRVVIRDENRLREIEKNLKEWANNPVSLLFFKSIRRIRIDNAETHWKSAGRGPTPESEWMMLNGSAENRFLIARSEPASFPDEAIAEIREERLLPDADALDLPPCQVEILLDDSGRLYVVLPTAVNTGLPFACNAPFIQDPAREQIKDPAISLTNRWLLQRVGALAARVMLGWLGNTTITVEERSRAYDLLPDVHTKNTSLQGSCKAIVNEIFEWYLFNPNFLLTDSGELKPIRQSVIAPDELFDVWPPDQITALFDPTKRPLFSRYVASRNRKILLDRGAIDEMSLSQVLNSLQSKRPPKPDGWSALLNLWVFVAPKVTAYGSSDYFKQNLHIVPTQGQNELYAASAVVRLGEERLLQSDEDWQFLSAHLLVMNQNWTRFLAEQRRTTSTGDNETSRATEAAFAVLKSIGMDMSSDAGKVMQQAALTFFKGSPPPVLADCVRMAQIAAKLNVAVGTSFSFFTRDSKIRTDSSDILFDENGHLEAILPDSWRKEHLLHADYTRHFTSCTQSEWRRWIASGRSGLREFISVQWDSVEIYGRNKIEKELRACGYYDAIFYPYKTEKFVLFESDFPDDVWGHWHALESAQPDIWLRVGRLVMAHQDYYLKESRCTSASQKATTGNLKDIHEGYALSRWLVKLRNLPCLPDTRGFAHKPSDLLLRNARTESFIDVEPFVEAALDTEKTKPLLSLLGVRGMPPGPDRALQCLRALAKAEKPPHAEIDKWYHRLDGMMDAVSTYEQGRVRTVFQAERLILTDKDTWVTSAEVFLLASEDDVPGAPLVRPAVNELSLWNKLGVVERPTVDLAIAWLRGVPSGEPLGADRLRRIRALLARHPQRIWEECQRWINLTGEWTPVEHLQYALTMSSLISWKNLDAWVKQKTADFQALRAETTRLKPFSDLALLANRLTHQLHGQPVLNGAARLVPWLNRLATDLSRVALDDDESTRRVRLVAAELAKTGWQTTTNLESLPYLDGTPAGVSTPTDFLWTDHTLYVNDLPDARLAKLISQEIGSRFGDPEIMAAIAYCFDRSPEQVTAYIEANFRMEPVQDGSETESVAIAGEQEPSTATSLTDGDQNVDIPGQIEIISTGDSYSPVTKGADLAGYMAVESSRIVSRRTLPKPSLMERFAIRHGYAQVRDGRFVRPDGACIGKTDGDLFPWGRFSASGEALQYYLSKEHCLEHEPLILESDRWLAIDRNPDLYSLILTSSSGAPVEIDGNTLHAWNNSGKLKLYPATYRLVYELDT